LDLPDRKWQSAPHRKANLRGLVLKNPAKTKKKRKKKKPGAQGLKAAPVLRDTA
jgi:hypothetical protein